MLLQARLSVRPEITAIGAPGKQTNATGRLVLRI